MRTRDHGVHDAIAVEIARGYVLSRAPHRVIGGGQLGLLRLGGLSLAGVEAQFTHFGQPGAGVVLQNNVVSRVQRDFSELVSGRLQLKEEIRSEGFRLSAAAQLRAHCARRDQSHSHDRQSKTIPA